MSESRDGQVVVDEVVSRQEIKPGMRYRCSPVRFDQSQGRDIKLYVEAQ